MNPRNMRPSLTRLRHTAGLATPEVSRPIAPRHSLRAEAHTCLPAEAKHYAQSEPDMPVTSICEYCGIPWPVKELRPVPIGHLIELCGSCRLGRTRCACPATVFGLRGGSDSTIWIPMTRKAQVCGLCAGVYDGMVIHPDQHMSAKGEHVAPYLDDREALVKPKRNTAPNAEVAAFYGASYRKG